MKSVALAPSVRKVALLPHPVGRAFAKPVHYGDSTA